VGAASVIGLPPPTPPCSATAFSHSPVGETRSLTELVPHPGLVKFSKGYSTQELSTLSERGEAAFTDLLTITHENVIVEGYALWELARLQGWPTVKCVVRHMDREAALLYLLGRNRGSKGIGDFTRILMALELEPWFRERAKVNQRFGGREKGSAHLAEAERLDVRIEVARAAGVSAGNVSKVKRIVQAGIPEIREALLTGEISINRATIWVGHAAPAQVRQLSDYRNERGIRSTINVLLRRHQAHHPALCAGLLEVQQGLRKLCADPNLSTLLSMLLSAVREIDQLMSRDEVKLAS
jgi:hypothetical protein